MRCATQGSFGKHIFKWNSARVPQPAVSPALGHIVSRWGAEGIRRNPFSDEDLGGYCPGSPDLKYDCKLARKSNGLHVTCLEKELRVRRGTTHMSHRKEKIAKSQSWLSLLLSSPRKWTCVRPSWKRTTLPWQRRWIQALLLRGNASEMPGFFRFSFTCVKT